MRALWLADVLRAGGLDVYEMPGWETRGRDMAWIDAVIAHHTATGQNWQDGHVAALLRDGRADLAGPLSQLGLERDGTFVVIASGRCNHNGLGLYGNNSIGIEAFNNGVGEPWREVHVEAYVTGAAALLRHMGLPATRFISHAEADPQRKVDPRGLDMDNLRLRVHATLTHTRDSQTGDDEMTAEQAAWLGRIHHELVANGTLRATVEASRLEIAALRQEVARLAAEHKA